MDKSYSKIIIICITILFAVCSRAQAHATSEEFEAQLAKVSNEIALLEAQVDTNPDDFKSVVQLASMLLKTGNFDRATDLYRAVPEKDTHYDSAKIGIAKILMKKHEFKAALTSLESVSDSPTVANLRARIYYLTSDYATAEDLYLNTLETTPSNANALVGKALCEQLRGNTDAFLELLTMATQADPDNSWAWLELANFYMEDRQEEKAWQTYRKALDVNPFNDVARAAYAFSFYRNKDMPQAARQLKIAVKLNPFNFQAHRNLGRGWADYIYPDNPPTEIIELSNQAAESVAHHDFDRTIELCNAALAIDQNWGMAHFLISEALYGKLRQQDYLSSACRETITKTESLEPQNITTFVPNYNDLSPDQKKVVCLSAAPLRKFIPTLIEKGGSFYILPLNMKLTESPNAMVKPGARTFDGRLWDDLKGLGGLNAVTGFSALEIVLNGDFNTFAHEFAHQVHIHALSEADKTKIIELYSKAMESNRTLDYYAASNEFEYFAVGYEAYVSSFKRSNIRITSKHTRQELFVRDPELFVFIANLVQ